MYDGLPDTDALLARLDRLVQDVIRGSIRRNTFQQWEVELLLDIQDCPLPGTALRRTLRRYQKTVRRQIERGGLRPPRFSEFARERPRQSNESHLVF